ncbi:MAG: HEAT repeat domain-containing protein [Bacteroidetes bacterium]|nr:HEAT repeat domain-containing protein [Bacteroidota bacterium]MCW5895721.1 HEAT repeat domain-containing protein [Bacteroidota bacterium]
MNHQQYRQWLLLSLYEELNSEEQSRLNKHLTQCRECRIELDELQKLHASLARAGSFAPDDALLNDARQNLRSALRAERTRPSMWDRLGDFVSDYIQPNYKIALGGVAMLAAGILVGRMLFPATQDTPVAQVADRHFSSAFEGEPRISNIRFLDSDAQDGMIEFTFDATSPVHIKGSINDERVQKVLAHALVNDQNPGIRLRSVNALSTQAEHHKPPDREVKAALILAARTDNNPAVRREALKTLGSFPFDEEIKQTYLHVLMQDTNPAMRIAAINGLDSARMQSPDADLLNVLKQRIQSDENSYVRIRAQAVLEEVKQQ